jgi:hypothetical protein
MTATGQNFTMYQGDTKIVDVTTYDEVGAVLNLTDGILNWVFYKRYPENIVLTKTTASGIALIDPTNGIFRMTLNPADTEGLLGEYNHECELTDTSNNISTLLVGKVSIYKSKA